jgi:hypothetical protein
MVTPCSIVSVHVVYMTLNDRDALIQYMLIAVSTFRPELEVKMAQFGDEV